MSDISLDGPSPIVIGSRYGRLPIAQTRSGLSRGALYDLAKKHKGLFRKYGAATIVDLEFLDQILGKLPPAEIGD
jgi:hypothetical protein